MRRLGTLAAILALLVCCGVADARKVHAATPRTLIKSGPSKAKSWAPEGKPALGDDLTIPAGKTLEISSLLKAGSLIEEPGATIKGVALLEMSGSLDLEGSSTWTGELRTMGINHLATHGNTLPLISNYGALTLTDPLTARTLHTYGSFDSGGYHMRIPATIYAQPGSFSNYETSEVEVGEWQVGGWEPEQQLFTWQYSDDASFTVLSEPEYSTAWFKGAGWAYDDVRFEGFEETVSGDSYTIEGEMVDNTPVLTIEGGQTITVEGPVVFGVNASLVRSTGATAYVHCGCSTTVETEGVVFY